MHPANGPPQHALMLRFMAQGRLAPLTSKHYTNLLLRLPRSVSYVSRCVAEMVCVYLAIGKSNQLGILRIYPQASRPAGHQALKESIKKKHKENSVLPQKLPDLYKTRQLHRPLLSPSLKYAQRPVGRDKVQ
jgi:hypothetical protein